MRPALVIFDCDGVLVDSERMEAGTLAEALTWLGIDRTAARDIAADLHDRNRGGKLADLLSLVAAETGRSVPDDFEARYREHQLARLASVDAVPGAVDVVAAVRSADLPRCVVSGGPLRKMEISLGATGMWDAFAPHIFSCYEIGDHKPSPGIYLHALERFGVEPAACIAIEDSAAGVTAAAAAGVPVIGLARDTEPAALTAVGACATATSMAAVGELLQHRWQTS